MDRLVVHMIANAHIDPVWLWTWPAGADEAVSTCRAACDMLDEYPELFVTRGEAWVHSQVEKLAPDVFARIASHARAGRWQVVNGWWVQPDCNLPSAQSFRKHAEIAGRYFRERLSLAATVGYNPDSFGHCATLPTFLREAGMDSYVFMRPGEHEKRLPTLFRWRSILGEEVTAFRIVRSYATWSVGDLEKNVEAAIAAADRRVGHVMCFFGVGDHGGGPTREQIEWIRSHARLGGGVELRFSHPRAFFDAVREGGAELPVVTGELQYHAIGCYSVVREIKREMRAAECLAAQAELAAKAFPGEAPPDWCGRLDEAWRRILFNQFHDILAGSSIRSAYEHARDELGAAKAAAREIVVAVTRRRASRLPRAPARRLVLANLSERRFRGLVEFEPWLGFGAAGAPVRLSGPDGASIPCQQIAAEAATGGPARLVFPVELPAAGEGVIELHRDREERAAPSVRLDGARLMNSELSALLGERGCDSIRYHAAGREVLGARGIRVEVFEDLTDTWSHGVASFDGRRLGVFEPCGEWRAAELGPLRAGAWRTFRAADATLLWRVFLDAGEGLLRMRLRLHWRGERKVVKLVVPAAFAPRRRLDGCPGGALERPLDGREYPVRDFVALEGEGLALAAASADVFAADVGPEGAIRLTLLRSPPYAFHDPFELPDAHAYPVTDQGVHEYEIALLVARSLDRDSLLDEAARQSNPVWVTELGERP